TLQRKLQGHASCTGAVWALLLSTTRADKPSDFFRQFSAESVPQIRYHAEFACYILTILFSVDLFQATSHIQSPLMFCRTVSEAADRYSRIRVCDSGLFGVEAESDTVQILRSFHRSWRGLFASAMVQCPDVQPISQVADAAKNKKINIERFYPTQNTGHFDHPESR